jgi:hypothetical protein
VEIEPQHVVLAYDGDCCFDSPRATVDNTDLDIIREVMGGVSWLSRRFADASALKVRSDGFATVLPPINLSERFTIISAGNPANLPLGMTARTFDNGR